MKAGDFRTPGVWFVTPGVCNRHELAQATGVEDQTPGEVFRLRESGLRLPGYAFGTDKSHSSEKCLDL